MELIACALTYKHYTIEHQWRTFSHCWRDEMAFSSIQRIEFKCSRVLPAHLRAWMICHAITLGIRRAISASNMVVASGELTAMGLSYGHHASNTITHIFLVLCVDLIYSIKYISFRITSNPFESLSACPHPRHKPHTFRLLNQKFADAILWMGI